MRKARCPFISPATCKSNANNQTSKNKRKSHFLTFHSTVSLYYRTYFQTIGKHRLLFSNSNEKQSRIFSRKSPLNLYFSIFFPFLSFVVRVDSLGHTRRFVCDNSPRWHLGQRHRTPTNNPLNLNTVSPRRESDGSLDFQRVVTCLDRRASTSTRHVETVRSFVVQIRRTKRDSLTIGGFKYGDARTHALMATTADVVHIEEPGATELRVIYRETVYI